MSISGSASTSGSSSASTSGSASGASVSAHRLPLVVQEKATSRVVWVFDDVPQCPKKIQRGGDDDGLSVRVDDVVVVMRDALALG